jgi:penicillin amidase
LPTGRIALVALVASLAAATPAAARITNAESILPPGQSGGVSLTGVTSGTGSPHLTDQLSLYKAFSFKSAMFNQPGPAELPRAGVKVTRDRYGVPAITGTSDYNAWWGVGYAIAQDRLFQLELFRRATSGRLAEVLGRDYLDDDLIARRDYYTDAEIDAQLRRLPPSLLRRGEAYRDGINAWLAKVRNNPAKLPGEFTALAIRPRDWTLRDTARIGVFLARTVPSGDGAEVPNGRALQGLSTRSFTKLIPLRNKRRVTTVPKRNGKFPSQPGRTRRQEQRSLRNSVKFVRGLKLPGAFGSSAATASSEKPDPLAVFRRHGGSYMWAINGRLKSRRKCRRVKRRGKVRRRCVRRYRKRKKGPAYLFNGPQLGFSIPELFVEFEIHSPTQNMRGVSAAGVPVMGIGHNSHLAWGLTSGLSDEDDLYAEQLQGSEGYRFKGGTRRMSCRDERFDYKAPVTSLPDVILDPTGGAGSRTVRICRTVHGPVQSRAGGRAYARRYAIWGRELETLVGLSGLNDARTVKQAGRSLLGVTWNENVIAADDRGGIGYWHPGLHPLRPLNYDERLPYPGTGQAEWRGLLPRRRTPHVINPRQGYLFNWNNMPSFGWTNGDSEARERMTGPFHRSAYLRRLVARVAKRPSYARSRAIDRSNGSHAQQRPLYTKQLKRIRRGTHGQTRAVLSALLRWDGSYVRVDSANTVDPGVAIWEEFKQQAARSALSRLGPLSAGRELSPQPGTSHVFDITNGEAYALRTLSRRRLRRAAVDAAIALAGRFHTSNVARWREKRRMYDVTAQGAAATPDLPFFDRGTWQQSVGLRP